MVSLLFFPQLFVNPPDRATLPSCVSFPLRWFWSLPSVQCYEPPSTVLQALCLTDLIPWIYSSLPLCNHKGFDLGHTWMAYWFSVLFFHLSLNFAKELMEWATVSSRSCFCCLYRASLFSCKEHNHSDFNVDHLLMSTCRVVSSVVEKGCLLLPACSFDKTLLAFAVLYFALQDHTCLYSRCHFLLFHSKPLWWKGQLLLVLVLEGIGSLHRLGQL